MFQSRSWGVVAVVAFAAVFSHAPLPTGVLPAEAAFKGKIAVNAKDSVPDWPKPPTALQDAPNILLILLDDAGFADTATFGGPALTPVLDQLAAEGLRYNRFHTAAICAPTRAALLSGRNQHRVGWGDFCGGGFPGYDGIWKKDAASIAEVLKDNGYSTAAFGKWHSTPPRDVPPVGPFDRWPTQRGFEYFFGDRFSNGSQWEPVLWRNTELLPPSARSEQAPMRVIRGGSFLCSQEYCLSYRPSARRRNDPYTSMSHIGIRLIMDRSNP